MIYFVFGYQVWPYPSDEKLQKDLEIHLRWDYHKKLNLKKVMRNNQLMKMSVDDARSSLQIPPITKDDDREYKR